MDKLLRRVDQKREQLSSAVLRGKAEDESAFQSARDEYIKQLAAWSENRELAEKVLARDPAALKEAIDSAAPFDELTQLGASVSYWIAPGAPVELSIRVNGDEVVPAEIKSLLQSGKLSVKRMPQGQFNELYQDYVCGCVLRVAREAFALLPIELVIVTAIGRVLDSATGYVAEVPILSAVIPRETLQRMNLERVDPSDSLRNVIHKMDFKKTKGFGAVERIKPGDVRS